MSLDTRHRVVAGGNFDVPWKIRVRPFIVFRSGKPFNITNGVDSNGDTLFTERPTFARLASRCDERGLTDSFCDFSDVLDFTRIIPRNYGTGPEYFNVNLQMSKKFEFGTRSGGDSAGIRNSRPNGRFGGNRGGGNDEDSRYNLEFTVSFRNLLNRVNLGNPVGNLRSSFFGQSISTVGGSSSAGNRRVELEVQFEF